MYVSSLLYSTIEEMKFCREFNDGTDGFLSTTMPTWRATAATAAAAATATTAASRRRARRAILFDGNSILHGAYHGTPPLSNARGEPVHAVFTALRSIVSWLGGGGGGNGTGEVSDLATTRGPTTTSRPSAGTAGSPRFAARSFPSTRRSARPRPKT